MTYGSARFAEVAVNSGQPARIPFTYEIPPGMGVEVGQAVFVPFGPKVLQGVVVGLVERPEVEGVRPISAVADPEPVLDEAHAALARWLSETYLAPLWDCVAVSLPSGFGQKPVTMVSPVDVPPLLPVTPQEQKVLKHLGAHGRVTLDALREAVGTVTMARLEKLQELGHLTVAQGLARPAGHARMERRVRLKRDGSEALTEAERREQGRRVIEGRVLRLLAGHGDSALLALREAGAGRSHLERLAADGWLEEYEERVERGPLSGYVFEAKERAALTAEQSAAAERMAGQPGEYLLHGITGSGKTEVYLDLVARALEAGGGAIVLVPEISLTPQAIRRYGERFGETLAVFHSGLGTGELFDQWYRVQRGEARLVLGSRSALFAPVRGLGLIVLDEEHEPSYKQDNPPRYHAREAARELAQLTGATLVLGSATPDVVSYQRSRTGASTLVTLEARVVAGAEGLTRGQLPSVRVVDMREELHEGNRSVFSRPLQEAVEGALREGEQSILFVNRRGSARFVICRDCGYMAECASCKVPMGLDSSDEQRPRLLCHQCGKAKVMDGVCPRCSKTRYRPFGVGTQRIEVEAKLAFPGARVARWDSDVASRKGSHERMVAALEAGEVDILVGTQMLAKGLDLPEMTVVGVVDADVGLSLPEYRAHERTFQLLSQVAGRAGRRAKPGTVVIQTYDPEAVPIQCAANHDYEGFFEHELAHRRRAGYPPFTRMVRLVFRHTNYELGLEEGSRVATELRLKRDAAGRPEPEVLGPTPAYIPRIRGEYRWQVLLKGHRPAELVAGIRLGTNWAVDVDPMSLL